MSVNKINKRNKGASTQEEWQEYAPQECQGTLGPSQKIKNHDKGA